MRAKHSVLEARIQFEQGRPAPDSLQIMLMKRLRLKLRDQINSLERGIGVREPAH
ncbi:MAG: YdcH family protein [Nitratireductor sp.]